jgi:hypothetical protein
LKSTPQNSMKEKNQLAGFEPAHTWWYLTRPMTSSVVICTPNKF